MFHTQGQDCLDQEEEIGVAEDGSDGSVQRACNKVGFQGIDLFLDHRCADFLCKARRRASPFACQPRWCTASASIWGCNAKSCGAPPRTCWASRPSLSSKPLTCLPCLLQPTSPGKLWMISELFTKWSCSEDLRMTYLVLGTPTSRNRSTAELDVPLPRNPGTGNFSFFYGSIGKICTIIGVV